MTITVKRRADLVVPTQVRRQAGIRAGDQVEFKVAAGVITIIPKLPGSEDEYTPEQRRLIDAQLDEAEKGPFEGPFNTADEMIAHLKSELKKRAATKKTKRSR
jgi:AbrB family looped-hinge helix DNA binding protein